jgi:hypothetical protein
MAAAIHTHLMPQQQVSMQLPGKGGVSQTLQQHCQMLHQAVCLVACWCLVKAPHPCCTTLQQQDMAAASLCPMKRPQQRWQCPGAVMQQ